MEIYAKCVIINIIFQRKNSVNKNQSISRESIFTFKITPINKVSFKGYWNIVSLIYSHELLSISYICPSFIRCTFRRIIFLPATFSRFLLLTWQAISFSVCEIPLLCFENKSNTCSFKTFPRSCTTLIFPPLFHIYPNTTLLFASWIHFVYYTTHRSSGHSLLSDEAFTVKACIPSINQRIYEKKQRVGGHWMGDRQTRVWQRKCTNTLRRKLFCFPVAGSSPLHNGWYQGKWIFTVFGWARRKSSTRPG